MVTDNNRYGDIEPIDPHEVLDQVEQLEVCRWTYKEDKLKARHMGPLAQDFVVAFGLGTDSNTIEAVDGIGVVLASIKALVDRVNQLEEEVLELRGETC